MLAEAEKQAAMHGAKTAYLEFDNRDSEPWVLDWCLRCGYDEVEFNQHYSLLKKDL